MANELENMFGKLIGYVLLVGILGILAYAALMIALPVAIVGVVIWGIYKGVTGYSRSLRARKEFLKMVEPPLKSVENEITRQERMSKEDGWDGRLRQIELELAKVRV
ncbi:MAG: hypothetical protein IKH04_03340 [Kiritimatiellae bacterium]|nr:hypothetical protein [Kiritimatiellia bacterium]